MFLLLIFFLMVATLAPRPPEPVEPPGVDDAGRLESDAVRIALGADGVVAHDGARGERHWRVSRRAFRDSVVAIHADRRAPAAALARLLGDWTRGRDAGPAGDGAAAMMPALEAPAFGGSRSGFMSSARGAAGTAGRRRSRASGGADRRRGPGRGAAVARGGLGGAAGGRGGAGPSGKPVVPDLAVPRLVRPARGVAAPAPARPEVRAPGDAARSGRASAGGAPKARPFAAPPPARRGGGQRARGRAPAPGPSAAALERGLGAEVRAALARAQRYPDRARTRG